ICENEGASSDGEKLTRPLASTAGSTTPATSPYSPNRSLPAATHAKLNWHDACAASGNDIVDFNTSVGDVMQTLFRVSCEAAPQELKDSSIGPVGHERPVGLTLENRSDEVRKGLAIERRLPGEHLIEHATECPDVRPFVDGFPAGLLRAHVGGRAKNDSLA